MMIVHGRSDRSFYCFTKDAARNNYPIFRIELVRKRVNREEVFVPEIREHLTNCVHVIGQIEVMLHAPVHAVDLSGYIPHVRSEEVPSGLQKFELLSVELPLSEMDSRFLELAVLPGTVHGLHWQGLIKATADYHRCRQFWAQRSQLKLPLEGG